MKWKWWRFIIKGIKKGYKKFFSKNLTDNECDEIIKKNDQE